MKIISAIIAVSLLFIGTVQADEISVKDMSKPELIQYINGLAAGVTYYQGMLEQTGERPLFCPPRGTTVGARKIWKLLNENLTGEFEDSSILAPVALSELQKAYPCKV